MPIWIPAAAAAALAASGPIEPISFTAVQIRDRFWQPRQEVNRKVSAWQQLEMLEKAGNLENMRRSAAGEMGGYVGFVFNDSDLYKVMEGISYSLHTHPDPKLEAELDKIIALLAEAQDEDGYLNSHFTIKEPDKRWTNLRDQHELYCAGHLIEAAVAHHAATGKRSLLDIAIKFAALIDQRYGPAGEVGYPGHPELELALVKLWRTTGDQRWFDLTSRMIYLRGSSFFAEEHSTPPERYDGTYWLDNVPICDTNDIAGHAVRAAYLMSGAADVAKENGDPALTQMLNRVWASAVERRAYITGGIGPSGHNEGFTVDYDLPNLSAYQETCASIAMAMWGHRMAMLSGEARHMDAVEAALYNGVLSGVGLDGKSYYYVNPLASNGNHARTEWFSCACCPPNVLRTVASVGGYAYAATRESLYVNLYLGGSLEAKVGGEDVKMEVQTDYPWDGRVQIGLKKPAKFGLRLRVPGWCEGASVKVNGSAVDAKQEKGYFVLDRAWKSGDQVELNLPMPIRQVAAHPKAKDNAGLAAVQRGPLIYCAESPDNAEPIRELVIPRGAEMKPQFQPDLLGGIVQITARAETAEPMDWSNRLYQALAPARMVEAKLIPYGFWSNRGRSSMAVWMPTQPLPSKILGPEGRAEVSMSSVSGNCQPWAIKDGIEPESSGQQPAELAHTWPRKGGEEWYQYAWKEPLKVSAIEIYWFDDTGRGECRLPASWRLQALVQGEWQDVPLKEAPTALDRWCRVEFPTVAASALRVVVQQQDGWSTGIHEWKVITAPGS